MPAGAAEPPLPCFPPLNTLPAFTATLSVPVLTHPPRAGRNDRKHPSALLLFLFLPYCSLSFFSYTSLALPCAWVQQYTYLRFWKNCNTSLPYFIYATISSSTLQWDHLSYKQWHPPSSLLPNLLKLLRHSEMSVKLINCDAEQWAGSSFFHVQTFFPQKMKRWRKASIRLSCSHLHASSSCRSTRVHRLNVAGFTASHHEAPAHSIAYDLRDKGDTLRQYGISVTVLTYTLIFQHISEYDSINTGHVKNILIGYSEF